MARLNDNLNLEKLTNMLALRLARFKNKNKGLTG